jgi:hypothetical protein
VGWNLQERRMKASELIYRLARAIEERGDLPVKMCIESDNNGENNADVKCLDILTSETNGLDCFEIYGEES